MAQGFSRFWLKNDGLKPISGKKIGSIQRGLWSWDGTHPTSKTTTKNEI